MCWAGVCWTAGVLVGGRRIMPRSNDHDESGSMLSWYLYEDLDDFDDE